MFTSPAADDCSSVRRVPVDDLGFLEVEAHYTPTMLNRLINLPASQEPLNLIARVLLCHMMRRHQDREPSPFKVQGEVLGLKVQRATLEDYRRILYHYESVFKGFDVGGVPIAVEIAARLPVIQ
jgi:hypothetical protein